MSKNITSTKLVILKDVTIYAAYLIIFWAFYRFLFKLPENIEELVIKPLTWLVPILFFLRKEKGRLLDIGLTLNNLFSSVYLSLGLGTLFVGEALLTNYLKYGQFNFAANIGSLPLLPSLGLSFATAFSEETAFRGYIFGRLSKVIKNEMTANLIQALLWTAIHIPIAFFVLKMTVAGGITYLFITAIFGVGSAFIFGRTRNVFGSVLLHVLWEWPIILFR